MLKKTECAKLYEIRVYKYIKNKRKQTNKDRSNF